MDNIANIILSKKFIKEYEYNPLYLDIDVVIGGGLMNGYGLCGCLELIRSLEEDKKLKIRNFHCVSAGILCTIFYICNIPVSNWIDSYYKGQQKYKKRNYINYKESLHDIIMDIFSQYLPDNAFELCNNRLYIYIAKLTNTGFVNIIINEFKSNNELLNAVSASINVPIILSNNLLGINFNNNDSITHTNLYDNVFINNLPIIYNNDLPQLVLKPHRFSYNYTFSLNDDCIELLMIRGLIDAHNFFKSNKNIETINWIEPNLIKKRSSHFHKSFSISYTDFNQNIICIPLFHNFKHIIKCNLFMCSIGFLFHYFNK